MTNVFMYTATLAPESSERKGADRSAALIDWLAGHHPTIGANNEGELIVLFEMVGTPEDTARSLLKTAMAKLALAASESGEVLPSITQVKAFPADIMRSVDSVEDIELFTEDLTDDYIELQLRSD